MSQLDMNIINVSLFVIFTFHVGLVYKIQNFVYTVLFICNSSKSYFNVPAGLTLMYM